MKTIDKLQNQGFMIGKTYEVITLTYHHRGIVTDVYYIGEFPFIKMEKCQFISESGKIIDMYKNKKAANEEWEPDQNINVSHITSFSVWE